MRKSISKLALTAGITLAITIALSCSSDDGGGGGGTSSPSENGDVSSSSGGGLLNDDPQIYNGYYDENDVFHIGSAYTGSGVIKMYLDEENLIDVGSVTNGIVNLNLPSNIPDVYLEEEQVEQCSSYPEGIKKFVGSFELINSNGDIYTLKLDYAEGQIRERIHYFYYSKTGKIICTNDDGEGFIEIIDIDAKAGWNKIYRHTSYAEVVGKAPMTNTYSTNNILTKQVKWTIRD